jgi:hypothetical protein
MQTFLLAVWLVVLEQGGWAFWLICGLNWGYMQVLGTGSQLVTLVSPEVCGLSAKSNIATVMLAIANVNVS